MNNKSILIGIPVKNTGKYLENLLNQITSQDYDLSKITVILLEGDSNDDSYDICKCIVKKYLNLSIIVDKLDLGYDLEHSQLRYSHDKFPNRIKNLVISRNYIVNNYLKQNDYLWWVDSDFEYIPSDTINKFIECDKDVIIPKLTHDKWGYHDCGSVVIEDGKQYRFQFIDRDIVKLDRADTHCFIKRHVFDANIKYTYIDKEYFDGCGGHQFCYSDGTQFAFDCISNGFEIYGANNIVIKHHNV